MNSYEYQKLRGLKRKLYLIDLRGGCCERCGYDKNISAFDFHHKDPTKKDSQLDIRVLSNSSMQYILEEFQKCELLCSNCHREEHSPELTLINVRLIIENSSEKIIESKVKGKPNCVECGKQINYTYSLCRECASIKRRTPNRPKIEVLINEVKEHGKTWCANKYKVSRTTIRRWLSK
jgi:hypothetical protein